MSSIGTGYDLSAAQFSPEGRVFQVEYSQKAVENSGTAIGLRGIDGCVFAVEKLVTSKLYETGVNMRIFTVDRHIGIAVAGFFPDARHIVEIYAKEEAANYRSEYKEAIPLASLKNKISMYMHAYTLYGSLRPFGASVIMGAYENNSPQLYCIESSGIVQGYYACAIGKAKEASKTEMEKIDCKEKTIAELVVEAAKIIYTVHDEVKDKNFELELSWVGKRTNGKHEMVPLKLLEAAEEFAKAAVEEDSDFEDQ